MERSFVGRISSALQELTTADFKQLSLDNFLTLTFSLVKKLKKDNTEKVLEVLLRLGQKIYQTKEQSGMDIFNEHLIGFGFIYPGEITINDDWQVQSDNNHLKMIRLWLELIKTSPSSSTRLITALIVNLKLGGVLIRDEDLFQRDISQLLNSDIKGSYVLIKQLLKLFPVYYSSIGAE